jgi:hypothetical protein
LRGCAAASSPEERMRSAARDARRRSVGAARWDEDGGEGEVRPPAAPADEEAEAASVAADEAAATKGGMSLRASAVQVLAIQISSRSKFFPFPGVRGKSV